jgi:cytochrome c553
MKASVARLAAVLVAAGTPVLHAQQPAPPAPSFAPSHVTGNGGRALAANCAPCHGTDGHAAPGSPLEPLAGRPAGRIIEIMAKFKDGTRPATLMHQIAKGYSDAEIAAIADYFEKQR